MRIRQFSLLVLAVAVVATGCRATSCCVAVDVRNVSSAPITLVVEQPGPFLLPSTDTHVIQPWQKGMCYAHLGLYSGHIKLTVSGPDIATPVAYEATTPSSPTEIGIQVDAEGHVVFGGTFPVDKLPCEGGGY